MSTNGKSKSLLKTRPPSSFPFPQVPLNLTAAPPTKPPPTAKTSKKRSNPFSVLQVDSEEEEEENISNKKSRTSNSATITTNSSSPEFKIVFAAPAFEYNPNSHSNIKIGDNGSTLVDALSSFSLSQGEESVKEGSTEALATLSLHNKGQEGGGVEEAEEKGKGKKESEVFRHPGYEGKIMSEVPQRKTQNPNGATTSDSDDEL